MALSTGQVLNERYRIVKLLGQGGFGAVYRAWDTTFEIPCAIKENLDVSPEAQRQFMREAKILRTLRHPNLPLVTDYFLLPSQGQYLVMDYVEGEDLQEMLLRVGGPLPEDQVREWMAQICAALEYLHTQDPPVIHRDIKPANIKITSKGQAMLVDFGIAKVYDPKLSTTIGARAITPGYSPQEQYGMGTTDARSDIYALGATAYHLLTGVQPPESIQRNYNDTMKVPNALNPSLSDEIGKAVINAMQPNPSQRFGSIADFKSAITHLPEPVHAQVAPAPVLQPAIVPQDIQKAADIPATVGTAPIKKPVRSRKWVWIGAVLGLVAVAIAVFLIYTSMAPPAVPAASSDFKACLVTDMGGIDDKSFNAAAWMGMEGAANELGIQIKYLESNRSEDYETNINALLDEGCNIIIGAGFLLSDAIKAAAEAHPGQPFAIIDAIYDPVIPNVRGSSFQIDQASFLAGYLAAGMTKTGKVGVYGGIQIPPVTLFMDGFIKGIWEYKNRHGTSIELKGWDLETQTGLFTGDFDNQGNGYMISKTLLNEGVDIILPVAGPVGMGTLELLKENGSGLMIGTDTDWSFYNPGLAEYILASVVKRMDIWVLDTIRQVYDGSFVGENSHGTLENGYVGLNYGSAWESRIPPELLAEIDKLVDELIASGFGTPP